MNDRLQSTKELAGPLRLRGFVLDTQVGELYTPDRRVASLRKQALEILLILGARPGEVVSKDELTRRVWPGVVVGEGSLVQAIADIRRALGDGDHRTVRTVARRGYMLVPDSPAPAETPAILTPEPAAERRVGVDAPARPASRFGAGIRPWGWLAVVSAVLAIAVALGFRPGRSTDETERALRLRQPLGRDVPALSIAVLPFRTDGEPAEEWFADAVLGDLITEVGRIVGSVVIARDTAYTYKDRPVDPREVARELRVRYVVQGRLRREGATVRLNFALVDGQDGQQRWAESFAFERARLDQALDDFVLRLARVVNLEVVMSEGHRTAALSPTEVSADDLAMRGLALWYRGFSRENLTAALALSEQAVALDPNSERGWGSVAFLSYHGAVNRWLEDTAAAWRRIEAAGAHLERLAPNGHFAYQTKTLLAFRNKDWAAMLRVSAEWADRYRNPNALGGYGYALMLNGRPDDAVGALERAIRLSPRDPFRAEWQYRLAFADFIQGRDEEARDWGRTAQAANPTLPWPPIHAAALLHLGAGEEGRRVCTEFLSRHPAFKLSDVARRLPGTDPRFVDGRERLVASLRKLGLP